MALDKCIAMHYSKDFTFKGVFMRKRSSSLSLPFSFLKQTRKDWLKLSDLPYICMYCGDPANNREHVIPYMYVGDNTPMVWACVQCNSIAGSRVFDDLYEKARYINDRLRIKYAAILDIPLWGEDKIKELEGRLKQNIKGMLEVQKWIRQRISWKANPTVLLVVKYLMDLEIGSDSVPLFAEISGIAISELKPLVMFEKKQKIENNLQQIKTSNNPRCSVCGVKVPLYYSSKMLEKCPKTHKNPQIPKICKCCDKLKDFTEYYKAAKICKECFKEKYQKRIGVAK